MCFFKTPKMPEIKTTAREVVPSTEAKTPESPQFGEGSKTKKTTARGKSGLIIKQGGSGTGLNI